MKPLHHLKRLCFNTQPRGGGCLPKLVGVGMQVPVSTHSRAEAAAEEAVEKAIKDNMFQHTAARRRLPPKGKITAKIMSVSTHSRAEAAANGSYPKTTS